MFGYIYVNEQELKVREYTAYRSFYCGLCRNLHQRYGRTAQMMLNYDLTFLAILLTGLYEPETLKEAHRCILHPMKKHPMAANEAVDYAADMCVLLSYQKLLDDWQDEKKTGRRALAALLKSGYDRIAALYPRQTKAVEDNIRLLHEAEQKNETDIDYVAGLTGRFLAEIFVWKEDVWHDDLRRMGYFLGKFIYLMDALEDVEKDRKKKNFNLFAQYGYIWGSRKEAEIRQVLTEMMIEASRAFERLPVLENAEIIRNILYSGVWCKYAAMKQLDEKKQQMHSAKKTPFVKKAEKQDKDGQQEKSREEENKEKIQK